MAHVVISFKATSNGKVTALLNGVDQNVDAQNSTLDYTRMAKGDYGLTVTVATKDGGSSGGDNCQTTVRNMSTDDTVLTIPDYLNTISAGRISDTAIATFTVT